MRAIWSFPSSGKRGAGVIGLLIVVVIMMLLTLMFMNGSERNGVPAAKTYIKKADDGACLTNRMSAKTKIMSIQISNPDVVLSPKMLEKMSDIPKCPDGGQFIYQNNEVYCSKHFPLPVTPATAAALATSATLGAAPATPAPATPGASAL